MFSLRNTISASCTQKLIMPKTKVYEYDYEWTGEENKLKGVNIQEKNPWNKPDWGVKPVSQSSSTSSYDLYPDRFDMNELQRRHQWEKPNWATVKDHDVNKNKDVISDPIPKPMLKKVSARCSQGENGSTSTGKRDKTNTPEQVDKEIVELEDRIEEAREKKAALEKQKQDDDEHERLKHTVEESRLEKARRLAKEREEARWRATLTERNQRDKEKREQARLLALQQSNLVASTSDSVWQKTGAEQDQRFQERVQQETLKRQTIDDQGKINEIEEYYEKDIKESTEETEPNVSVSKDEKTSSLLTTDALQTQIDELRRQLEMA
jgi:hypothetical protein